VLAALLRKFHDAKEKNAPEVIVWGTGTPRREFLHADDLAAACLFLMESYDEAGLVNIGVGEDITIRELAELIGEITGYSGKILYDPTRPDGTPRKLMDVSKIHSLGWKAQIPLREGIEKVYREKFGKVEVEKQNKSS
jgi:GDP-L-fucose synthase